MSNFRYNGYGNSLTGSIYVAGDNGEDIVYSAEEIVDILNNYEELIDKYLYENIQLKNEIKELERTIESGSKYNKQLYDKLTTLKNKELSE